MKNIWILTEERPKANVIQKILEKAAEDHSFTLAISEIKITPVIKNNAFTFVYKVEGINSDSFKNIYIKIASGNSSFVDFLIFIQENEPVQSDKPIYAIEETKTDDSESRNTGIYQRCSKFVYVEFYYPGVKKIMLYNLQIPQKETATDTNIFGMKMLTTIGVEVMGKVYDPEAIKPFTNLDEFITAKNAMRLPPSIANTPIRINNLPDKITVSGRLYKSGGIGHDPNIGALTIIALCIRKWETTKDIVITQHGLEQENVTNANNKFIQIAHRLKIKLENIDLPIATTHEMYWHYDMSQEKMGTVFLHVCLLAYTNAEVIYANHGGSERGYFMHKELGPIAIEKYQEGQREVYKSGDKTAIIYIPDMIVFDPQKNEVINVEGKKYSTRQQGIEDLKNYGYIEEKIIKPSHNPSTIIRTVALFGGTEQAIKEKEISFLLNENGGVILSEDAPEIFKEAIEKALSTQNI